MHYQDCKDLFKNLLFHDDFVTVNSLFVLKEYSIDHKPPYQRNFMWSFAKGTNYIETLLLYRESTPFVWIDCENPKELIDGRQRFQILQFFINDEFSLRKEGLNKLRNLAGLKFSDLDPETQSRIKDTSLRVIKIIVKNENSLDEVSLDKIKREIFYRYNKGITAPKKEEISKAYFMKNSIMTFFKESFLKNQLFEAQIKSVFNHRIKNQETLLQLIRQLLVMHKIPVSKFAYERDDIVNKYFEALTHESYTKESITNIYNNFKEKIYFLSEFATDLKKKFDGSIGLVCECLYWALTICDLEKVKFSVINQHSFKIKLLKFFIEKKEDYSLLHYHRYEKIKKRYGLIASLLESNFKIPSSKYLLVSTESNFFEKKAEKVLEKRVTVPNLNEHFGDVSPREKTIREICNLIERKVLNIQPKYQRKEVEDYNIASSLIESILFQMSLHPIYLFLRKDGIHEVVDGLQRLLTILAYLGKNYTDESGTNKETLKHEFRLRLKGSELDKKKFTQLSGQQQSDFYNYKIHVIIIKEKEFPGFRPEEFFTRINYKPCPIKQHSFELWNSYIDNRIIKRIKEISKKHTWLRIRINDKRMSNEEIVTFLAYLSFKSQNEILSFESISKSLQIHFHLGVPSISIKRAQITEVLESNKNLHLFLEACSALENDFIYKSEYIFDLTRSTKNKRNELEKTFSPGGKTSKMSFLILWIILAGIPEVTVAKNKDEIKKAITNLYLTIRKDSNKEKFETLIKKIWTRFQKNNNLNIKNASTTSSNNLLPIPH